MMGNKSCLPAAGRRASGARCGKGPPRARRSRPSVFEPVHQQHQQHPAAPPARPPRPTPGVCPEPTRTRAESAKAPKFQSRQRQARRDPKPPTRKPSPLARAAPRAAAPDGPARAPRKVQKCQSNNRPKDQSAWPNPPAPPERTKKGRPPAGPPPFHPPGVRPGARLTPPPRRAPASRPWSSTASRRCRPGSSPASRRARWPGPPSRRSGSRRSCRR